MIQLVAHTTESAATKPGIDAGDLSMEIHDGDVDLSGPGYALMDIILIEGFSKSQVKNFLLNKIPEKREASRLNARTTWGFDTIIETLAVWDNEGSWCELVAKPRLPLNIVLTQQQRDDLADPGVSGGAKQAIMNSAITEKIHLNVLNLTEVDDLNA